MTIIINTLLKIHVKSDPSTLFLLWALKYLVMAL